VKKYIFRTILLFITAFLFAQTSSLSTGIRNEEMYLIPQTLYVGDSGRLVLPLGAAYAEIEGIVITEKNLLPASAELVISRMEIDTKTDVPRLLVDFRSYVPGLLELPTLNVGSYQFTDLKVQISSILEEDRDRVLSAAEPSMAVPGTIVFVYGSIFGLIFFLLAAFLFGFRGIPAIRVFLLRRHRRFVLRTFKRSIQKIRNAITKNDLCNNEYLAQLSHDFRSFLFFFTKLNCFTMVPKEFLQLSKMMHLNELKGGEIFIFEQTETLFDIFKHCDDLRFSGTVYKKESVFQLLDRMSIFAAEFESYEKDFSFKHLSVSSASEFAS
jgi:hypothetical protein